jgi:LPXTG-site transpeptidase (sortase) family protein
MKAQTVRSKRQAAKTFSKKWILLGVAIVLFMGGAYLLLLTFAPLLPRFNTQQITLSSQQPIEQNRVYIPAIGVDVAIAEGGPEALEKGAWHRKPENGNPEKGGNFVLSAHRFQIGFTPGQTQELSPFYHIDKLNSGDEIIVDWSGKRYQYTVHHKYKVDRHAVEIEKQSESPKLTLYSCDLAGEQAGREVVEAVPTTQT